MDDRTGVVADRHTAEAGAGDRTVEATGGERPSIRGYVLVVGGAGLALIAAAAVNGRTSLEDPPRELLLLSLFVLLAELRPIRVSRGGEEGEASSATPFVFGILLTAGVAAAVLVHATAILIADLAWRRDSGLIIVRAAHYAIALAAAGAELAFVRPDLSAEFGFGAEDILAVLAAASVFFATSYLLTSVQHALAQGLPIVRYIVRHFLFHLSVTGALLALAPLVVAAARLEFALVPVVALPAVFVYQRARAVLLGQHQAVHDRTTDLPNRVLVRERLQQAVTDATREGGVVVVTVVQVPTIDEADTSVGHQAGEDALRAAATAMRAAVRRGSLLGVLERGRFVHVRGSAPASAPETDAVRLLEALGAADVTVGQTGLAVSAEAGVSLYPEHGEDADALLRAAASAARTAGRRRTGPLVYSAARDGVDADRLALAGDLRRAVAARALVLHYQPQADAATHRVVGAEALIRWDRATPDVFLPVAESTGLIVPLTGFVLEEAARRLTEWRAAGYELTISVNISAHSLYDPDFADFVRSLVERCEIPAHALVIELTESVAVADIGNAIEVLQALRNCGVGLALDDFGTGYSSLAHLKNLGVDELKIDKSFVANMTRDTADHQIVRSTIELARSLGLRVVAEGVEDAETAAELAGLGCERIQGFVVGRPMPAGEFEDALRTPRAAGLAEQAGGRTYPAE